MEIKDLKARQGNVEIIAEVIEKSQPRTFNKDGKQGRVCNAKIKDSSGSVSLTLWNEDVDKVDVGDKIKISNGYVGEWQGELQLGAGKFGKIEVLEKAAKKETEEIKKNFEVNEEQLGSESEEIDEDVDVEEEFF